MHDIESVDDIANVVHDFYRTALQDPLIGSFFTEVISLDFEHHIPLIIKFWDSILFGNTSYKGNPMIKHIELDRKSRLSKNHFDRWLMIWETTLTKSYRGPKQEEAIRRARDIAGLMLYKIEQKANGKSIL